MSMQPSVIHAPSTSINQGNGQSAQDVNQTDEIISEDEARKRREQLNRRPSYRMILKDLETVDKQLKKDPDDVDDGNSIDHQRARPMTEQPTHSIANDSSISYPTVMASHLQVPNGDMSGLQLGIQTSGVAVTIGQYSPQVISNRGQDLPQNSVLGLNLPVNSDILGLKPMPMDGGLATSGAQFVTNNHEWSSNLMSGYNSSPSPLGMAGGSRGNELNDDGTRKRQVRLLKNREAAKECRRKKKEYVKCLENRVAVLENQNKALIEELKTLKELYCRKEKGD